MGNDKTVVLSLDDFSVVNNRMDLLLKLKEYFPDFKVSLFTVPYDVESDWGPYLIKDESLELIKQNLDWIQLIPHGLFHLNRNEMIAFGNINAIFDSIELVFNSLGLPFEKGFKSPHYSWNEEVVKKLDSMGWFGAINPFKSKLKTKKFYRHTHTIDNIDYSKDFLKLSGHVYGCKDDLGKNMDNLLKLPKNTNFEFVTQHIESL